MNSYISAAIGLLCGLLCNFLVYFSTTQTGPFRRSKRKRTNASLHRNTSHQRYKSVRRRHFVCSAYVQNSKNNIRSNKIALYLTGIFAVVLVALGVLGINTETRSIKSYSEKRELITTACKNHYYNQNYGLAYDSLMEFEANDPEKWLTEAFS